MRLTLRDYQRDCVDAHWPALQERGSNPLFVVPTGGGKSLIIAEFIEQTLKAWPDTNILMLTHVKELIAQNHDELVGQWRDGLCPVGIYSAGLGRREHDQRITFAGIQSAVGCPELLRHWDVVIIDEAHLVPKEGQGRYRTFLEALGAINPSMRVCGYTATHYRLDGGYLHKGKGAIFNKIAYTVPVKLLIEKGYLCNVRSKRPDAQIDTSGIRKQAGDFARKGMEESAMAGDHVRDAVAETVEIAHQENRKSWLLFAITVKHAEAIEQELAMHDVHAETIFGHTAKDTRADRVARFKGGQLRALINVGCLTTGFNAPRCDLGAIMRPTQSVALYVQMLGRLMRTFPGKEDALLLDFGRNVERHGPIDMIEIDEDGEKATAGDAPVKVCPQCKEELPLAVKQCPACGYVFTSEDDRKHEHKASTASPIQWEAPEPPKPQRVLAMGARRWSKAGSPDTLRIDYIIGTMPVSEWVCLEHTGFARRKAIKWWTEMAKPGEFSLPPDTVEEALGRLHELDPPSHAVAMQQGKYWRVLKTLHGLDPTEYTITGQADDERPARLELTEDEIPF